jgi:flagellar assembly protein FliH
MFKPLDFGPRHGFARDARFWPDSNAPAPEPADAAPAVPAGAPDGVETARLEGYRQGREEALAEAEEQRQTDRHAEAAFALSLARLDETQVARLAEYLRETVTALCDALIADAALDPELLARRAEVAARLLSRADDGRVFRLHPEDVALLAGRLPADWTIIPDPALERGSIRVEGAGGGVEDGPATWRRAVEEALRTC